MNLRGPARLVDSALGLQLTSIPPPDPSFFSDLLMFAIMSLKFAWVVGILTVLVTLPFTCARAVLEERDDNLPARVPYVFPAPGTDAVRAQLREGPITRLTIH